MVVLGGMAVFRGIVAADVAAFKAHPKMNPPIAGLHTVFADVLFGAGDLDFIQMGTLSSHRTSDKPYR